MSSILERSLGTRGLAALVAFGLFPQLLSAAPDIALQMNVDVAVPAAGQPVEFTVKASNVGDVAAAGVVVSDKLPAELAIPAGRAAFTSVGTYDPATGAWSIDSLDPGTSATLVIPAIVVAQVQPPCIINIAETSHSLDTQRDRPRIHPALLSVLAARGSGHRRARLAAVPRAHAADAAGVGGGFPKDERSSMRDHAGARPGVAPDEAAVHLTN